MPCFRRAATSELGLKQTDIGFWCSGSSDYLAGRAFSFVSALDAIGAVPPINESHVEMDAAWALYEAWVKIQTGEVDTALVYGFGKSSAGTLRRVLALQLDPYTVAPLWPDSVSLAGLQARLGLDAGKWTSRADGRGGAGPLAAPTPTENAYAIRRGRLERIDELLARPVSPTRCARHDCAPITDGAAAIVLAAGDRARELRERPGVDPRHRAPHRTAGARRARPHRVAVDRGVGRSGPGGDGGSIEVAELTRRSPTRS